MRAGDEVDVESRGLGRDLLAHLFDPRTSGVDEGARAADPHVRSLDVPHLESVAFPRRSGEARGRDRASAEGFRRSDHRAHERRVVGLPVEVPEHGFEAVRAESVEIPPRAARQTLEARLAREVPEQRVEREPGADLPRAPRCVPVHGDVEGDEAHEARRDAEERRALLERFAHESELERLEVAQPAVHELARSTRRARGGRALLEEQAAVASRCGGLEHAGSVDAAADHDDVEGARARSCVHRLRASRSRMAGIMSPIAKVSTRSTPRRTRSIARAGSATS